ncbi:peroxidase-like isoform X1 [Varroa jacobsoni]|uniref:peroxidase-like isoform X1 n=2 Tax=Varroa jacobsoni TaxID=62625 RepID=UPI000BF48A30|nr:peroxidase-like isoform X1 [Varroa jacobsoni]
MERMRLMLVPLAVLGLLVVAISATVAQPDVTGDDPELEEFDYEMSDSDPEDRTELRDGWKVWVSPFHLTGFKLSTVTTTMDRHMTKMRQRDKDRATAGMDQETIARLEPLNCQDSGPYRTFDGSCNNLFYGCWGRAGETYGRLLPPDYADEMGKPRWGKKGHKLPNVRELSRVMQGNQVQSSQTSSATYTDMTTHFGQFLAHEVSSAAPYFDKEIRNGKVVRITPVCCHKVNKDSECHPIEIGHGDPFYEDGHCIELVRSRPYNASETACLKNNAVKSNIREQVNVVTSFIDGSVIYGSSTKKAESLVDDDGSMKMDRNSRYIRGGLMPRTDEEGSCSSYYPGCDGRCFKAGDIRASLTPMLGALQTIYLREHNRIASHFVQRNWTKWQVYNVSRKIVGAMIQVITFKEYLPLMLGQETMSRYNLTIPSPQYRYHHHLNPSIINTWATAACRVSHSNVADKMKREGKTLDRCPSLAYDINNMDDYCKPETDPVRSFLVGACEQRMQELNTVYTREVTRYLFSTPMKPGKDLRSIDYHRGRDHGIPSYNQWRQLCGLRPYGSFEAMKAACSNRYGDLINKLKHLYNNEIDDLDFGVGAILEPVFPGSTFGPTVTCLFGHQFNRLKFGDRFWFENPKVPTAFTKGQLSRIYRITLAGLICANTDILRIQRNVFLIPGSTNPVVSCSQLLAEQDLQLNSYNY